MLPIKSFDPAATPTGGMIALNATDPGAHILFYNESNNNLRLDFRNGNQDILHAWEARWWTLDGNTDEIDWTIDSTLIHLTAPISQVSGTLYNPSEELPGTYPQPLIRFATLTSPLLDLYNHSAQDVHMSGATFALVVGDFSSMTVFINFIGFTGGTAPTITFEIDFEDTTGNWFKMSNLTALSTAGMQTFLWGESSGALPAFVRVAWTVTGAPTGATADINVLAR